MTTTHERNGWIIGLILIALGALFLLQNAGVPVFVGNWWALFILIPAIGAFASAYRLYQQDRRVTPSVTGLITGGLVSLTVALIFLFDADFGSAWPLVLVVLGVGMLLRPSVSERNERPDQSA